jgi:CHAT domain-containing protein
MLKHRSVPATVVAWLAAAGLAATFSRAAGDRAGEHEASLDSELSAAFSGARPTRARLSVNLTYAPWLPDSPSSTSVSSGQILARARAMAKLESLAESESAEGQRARVLLRILSGPLEEAVEPLAHSTQEAATDIELLLDLGAAYLARAERLQRPQDRLAAIEVAKRAVTAGPRDPRALFNLALALDLPFLRRTAADAWESFLAVDGISGWAEEARQALAARARPTLGAAWDERVPRVQAALQQRDHEGVAELLRDFPQQATRYLEEELMVDWAEAVLERDQSAAADYLASAVLFAEELSRTTGDQTLEGQIAALAPRALDPATASATLDLEHGRSACLGGDNAYGGRLLRRAREAFERTGAPQVLWIEFHLAVCQYVHADFDGALSRLQALLAQVRELTSPRLRSRVLWMIGLTRIQQGQPGLALKVYSAALPLTVRVGFIEDTAAIEYLTGQALASLGMDDDAWAPLFRGAAAAARSGEHRRVYSALQVAGDTASSQGYPHSALVLRQELVEEARRQPDAAGMAYGLLWLAEAQIDLGQLSLAMATLGEAEQRAGAINDQAARRMALARLHMAQAKAELDPSRALRLLAMARQEVDGSGLKIFLPFVSIAEARLHLRAGQAQSAARVLRGALVLFERMRAETAGSGVRRDFWNHVSEAIDLLVRATEDTAPEEAFYYSDRGRARVLLDHLLPPAAAPVQSEPRSTIDSLVDHLPSGTALLAYRVLEDRLLIWLLRDGEFHQFRVAVSHATLATEIERLRAAINGSDEQRELLAKLYHQLIAPGADYLQEGDALLLVTDKELQLVPFAALLSTTGKYLVERHPLALLPSATCLLVPEPSRRGTAARGLLSIGDPTFDRRQFPGLEPLRGAREEATAVASLYRHAETLVGDAATRTALRSQTAGKAIVHLAVHALPNPNHPELARIVLAPESPEDDGALYARDIPELPLAQTRLVVLSGCATHSGQWANAEGTLSIAESFLAAGVPAVVGTLWPVDDQAALALMLSFHSHYRRGASPAVALQQAQLDALRGPAGFRSPAAWASFVVLQSQGGGSTLTKGEAQ